MARKTLKSKTRHNKRSMPGKGESKQYTGDGRRVRKPTKEVEHSGRVTVRKGTT